MFVHGAIPLYKMEHAYVCTTCVSMAQLYKVEHNSTQCNSIVEEGTWLVEFNCTRWNTFAQGDALNKMKQHVIQLYKMEHVVQGAIHDQLYKMEHVCTSWNARHNS
jgi:phosphoketolase